MNAIVEHDEIRKRMSATTSLIVDRRGFSRTAAAFAGLALAGCASPLRGRGIGPGFGYGALKSDPAGLLDLPDGFAYRVLSSFGERMDDGHVVPDRADGMGAIALGPDRYALVRNHELAPRNIVDGAFSVQKVAAPAFDRLADRRALPGGTTTIVIDARTGGIISQHLSLVGTIRNCAGATTPWGSWLTCEEDVTRAGEAGTRDHGWVFEVPAVARGPIEPVPLVAIGRFNHEVAAVDPRTGIVYLTEDRDDGLLYRFLPDRAGQLARGGRLQALALLDPARTDSRNWTSADVVERDWLPVRWIDLDGTDSPDDDLRRRGTAKGALRFARGEGIHMGDGELFFCCTSGGAAKLGQVMRYYPARDEGRPGERGALQLFVESRDKAMLDFGDNLTVAPNGHLIICEDQYTDTVANRLIGVSPEGQAYVIAALHAQTELAGACFSPDSGTLHVNLYSPAKTLAITGPWARVA